MCILQYNIFEFEIHVLNLVLSNNSSYIFIKKITQFYFCVLYKKIFLQFLNQFSSIKITSHLMKISKNP